MKKLFIVFSFVVSVFLLFSCQKQEQVTIGVTIGSFDDVFIRNVLEDLKVYAQTKNIRIVDADSKSDTVEQLKIVDNFITRKVDAIILQTLNQDIAKTITEKALAANIPLVYLNRRPNDADLPPNTKIAAVASQEVAAGNTHAQLMVDMLGGKGNVVIFLGVLGSEPQIKRLEGEKQILAKNPGISVIKEQTGNWSRAEALTIMENWIASGDVINGVLSQNDEMAIGASRALQEKGLRESTIIGGIDASPDGLAALQSGEIDYTLFQNGKEQAIQSVNIALQMINDEPFERDVSLPYEPVTRENIDQYLNR